MVRRTALALSVAATLSVFGLTALADASNPGAAPPPEQLEEQMLDWHARKKRAATILFSATGVAFVVIGVVRFRARAVRRRSARSDDGAA